RRPTPPQAGLFPHRGLLTRKTAAKGAKRERAPPTRNRPSAPAFSRHYYPAPPHRHGKPTNQASRATSPPTTTSHTTVELARFSTLSAMTPVSVRVAVRPGRQTVRKQPACQRPAGATAYPALP